MAVDPTTIATVTVVPGPQDSAGAMTPGDARAHEAVRRWRAAGTPTTWTSRLSSLALDGLRRLPGAGLVDEVVVGSLGAVVVGPLREVGLRLGWALAGGPDEVVRAVAAAGHPVGELADLRGLDVADLRAVRPALVRVHVAAAGVRGGLTGFAAGAAAGASSAATGVAAAVASAGLDTVLAAATCTRAVARVALHYGYDPAEPAERAFALAVLAAGLSPDPTAAAPGVPDLSSPACDAARALPSALGLGLGVVLSTRQIARVLETAEHLYTERLLAEKYDGLVADPDESSVA